MEVVFSDIVDIYNEIKKNTRNKKKIYQFEMFKMENLVSIYNKVINDNYIFDKYNIFLVKYPKYRVIMSQSISDKIVNHLITRKILIPKLERFLDFRNVATRKNKGRDYGIRLIKKYLEYYKYKDSCYVLKLDISKYFYNIDHDVLKRLLKDKLDSNEYRIICNIIDSTNNTYINECINKLKVREINNTKRIDEVKEIPLYNHNKGLGIGQMTNQFLSIFYLYELDHKIIHDYHVKHYVRYMDDLILFSSSKEYLYRIKVLIESYIDKYYKLKLNKKKCMIVNIKHGFNFLGYRFRIINNKTIINIDSSTKRRVVKRIKEIKYLYSNNMIKFKQVFSSINTYYYGFKYGSKLNIRRRINKYFYEV